MRTTHRITLVLGGTRSGKSEVAEARCVALGAGPDAPVTYLATYRPPAGSAPDPDMAGRIAAHAARRPAHWRTVEVGAALAPALAEAHGAVLVDSLGTWVATSADPDPAPLVAALTARAARGEPTVVVSEEVGMGVHPPTEVGRRFADALGRVNRAVADVADEVVLVVAGRTLDLGRP